MKFKVLPGQGPLQLDDAGGNIEYGPFLEGATYNLGAIPIWLWHQWETAHKIEVLKD